MPFNCGAGVDPWESLGQQGNQTINPKGDQPWIFIERTDTEAEVAILWPPDVKSWLTGCQERLRAGGKGGERGWDGWMPSLTQWIWIWANSMR